MDPPFPKSKYTKKKFYGHWEAFYSQRIFPGKDLNIPGRHVDSRGFVCDENGYICVATLLVKMGQKIQTSYGMGKRYDTSSSPDIVEIYTNW